MAIVTISREFGTIGKEIGQMLARRLGYDYVDREKILHDVKSIGGNQWEKLGEEFDEHYPNVWERHDWSFRGFVALAQSIFLDYALKDKAVLIGRGGNFLLKDIPYVLKVRVVMAKEARIERIMKDQDIPRDTARWLVEKADHEMARSVQFIYGKKWDDPSEYDMILDLDSQQPEEIIKLIITALTDKQNKYSEEAKKALRLKAAAAKVKAGILTNTSFLIPVFDAEPAGDGIVLRGVIHNPQEQKRLEEEVKKLAGEVPIKFELHYRGLIRS
ncbi:MAG TPA: cytidylate kinase-like family protein [Thermodesulfobacteriota bacterium]|nr:cytidylate kinase-like family protein [Thermodesulfobacteriota bacterium]